MNSNALQLSQFGFNLTANGNISRGGVNQFIAYVTVRRTRTYAVGTCNVQSVVRNTNFLKCHMMWHAVYFTFPFWTVYELLVCSRALK